VSFVHSTQIHFWVTRPRFQTGIVPTSAEEDPQLALPVEGVAHPRAGQTVFGYHDQLAILFQKSDRHPAALARATPDRLDDDCVSPRVRRTGKAQTKRPYPQWVSKPPRCSLNPGLLGTWHSRTLTSSWSASLPSCRWRWSLRWESTVQQTAKIVSWLRYSFYVDAVVLAGTPLGPGPGPGGACS